MKGWGWGGGGSFNSLSSAMNLTRHPVGPRHNPAPRSFSSSRGGVCCWEEQGHVRKLTSPHHGLAKKSTACVCSDDPTRMVGG